MKRGLGQARGLTLLEVLVSTAIAALALAGIARLLGVAQAVWRADVARIEQQQRGRAAAAAVSRTLIGAGAGAAQGPAVGPLLRMLPPLVPRRIGRRGADPPDTFRPDAFSAITALAPAEHGTLLVPLPAQAAMLLLDPAGCLDPRCGFTAGATALVADAAGNHDIFSVLAVEGNSLSLRHNGAGNQTAYEAGSPVLHVETVTWGLDRATRTLRRYDGDASDVPVLDDVVEMAVEYFGERLPPHFPQPPAGVSNCLYDQEGRLQEPLMPLLQVPGAAPVRLSSELLTDGPWCGRGDTLFDADLLRVRRLRVTLRLQASDPGARGTDPQRFRFPGTAASAAAMVPDVSVVVDVTPRNLQTAW